MSFTHLHAHTEYSLLDSSNKINKYVARVKELGMDSAAITDHGNMYGVIDFYTECKENGINPILGCEVYVASDSRFNKSLRKGEERYRHLVLLAENNTGYENLMKLVSKSFTEGFYYKPRVDFELLEQYHEGLIALSACLAGEIPKALIADDYETAVKTALKYQRIFGREHFYLELQDHGILQQKTVNGGLMRLSQELCIPLVATNDIHYTYAEDAEPHDILLCMQSNKKLTDPDRIRYEGEQYYVKSEEEMKALFPYALEAIENTHKIAQRCHVDIEFNHYKIPRFKTPGNVDSWTYLNELCEAGLAERYPDADRKVKERLSYELGIIRQMGFVDYFLIVWDFIHYARKQGIPVGPGRGSGAGSVVAYCLHITNIDPLENNLIFERFLNPERVSMPDLDVDFSDERRQEVIDYVTEKYGAAKVAKIIAFDTMKAKRVIKDVARVMEIPLADANALAKMVPEENGITLQRAMESNPDLKVRYEREESIHHMLDLCLKLEGLPRNSTKHPAGVLIAPLAVEEYVPLCIEKDAGCIMTQYPAPTVEKLGLLKMDFLGLKTLSVIHNATEQIKRNHNVEQDMEKISYTDPEVYKLLGSGHTEGIFQLENSGMMNFMRQLKPHSLENLTAGISLYRPGPMDYIPQYIAGKESGGKIEYECEQLRPILEPTYGCIVYQEQVMQIVRELAGFSMSQADEVRKAMSKKKQDKMAEDRISFVHGNAELGIKGCIANGISVKTAESIYDHMMDFARYAFNKSHAAAYAVVAYQTAFLKCYYPKEYMAALLTSVMDETKKISKYIYACKEMGIKVMPPDINEGYGDFTVTEKGLRYGMSAIKGIGVSAIDAIVSERALNGAYTSLTDLVERLGETLNKKAVEGLIKSGALDSLGANRNQLLSIYEEVMSREAANRKNGITGQMSLFDLFSDSAIPKDTLPDIPEFSKEKILQFEKDVMGIYVSGHPLEEYSELMSKYCTGTTLEFANEDGEIVTIGGMITASKIITTQKGELMAFIMLEDMISGVEVVVFPRIFEQYRQFLAEDNKVFIKGKIQVEEGDNVKLIADKIIPFQLAGI